ncbi:MAG: SRPBCC family protein [Myxococcaceae bacterium]|nr:SRPBCC family protein [Myxococcaceae bacterium]
MSTPNGKVTVDGEFATLEFERQLRFPPEEVWSALTDPAQLREWYLVIRAEIDGRPGGTVEMVTGPAAFHWTGKILAWEPNRLFEYEWNTPPCKDLPEGEQTVVRWELTPSGGGTLLKLTHRRLTKNTAFGFAPGTHAFMDRLEAHLARQPLPNWMQRYGEVRGAYPAMAPRA